MNKAANQQLDNFLRSLSLMAGEVVGGVKVFELVAQAAVRDLDCIYLSLELFTGQGLGSTMLHEHGCAPATVDAAGLRRGAAAAFRAPERADPTRFDTAGAGFNWSAWPLRRGDSLAGVVGACWGAGAERPRTAPGAAFHPAFNLAALLIARGLTIEELRAQQAALMDENLYLREEVKTRFRGEDIICNSGRMEELLQTALRVASSRATVLIHGETGTGKELLAHLIHKHSPRANGPFIRVNCAALPDTLLESELFGHVKGAFTGATADRKGRFEAASGGTLLLDEVGDISPHLQVRLLRVLQEREIERVGDNQPRAIDVRVIAATHRNLEEAVAGGRFREDLYYRLNVVYLHIPPLRERPEDIMPLCEHFLDRFNRENYKQVSISSAAVIARLQEYSWPGNVRELQNCIEKAVVLAPGGELGLDLLPGALAVAVPAPDGGPAVAAPAATAALGAAAAARTSSLLAAGGSAGRLHREVLGEAEKAMLETVLRATRGRQLPASRLLGINRNTLNKRLREHGLDGGPAGGGMP